MVMSFRVSELQVLLGYAGRNKTACSQIFASNRRKAPVSGKGPDGDPVGLKSEPSGYRGPLDFGASILSHETSHSSASSIPHHPDVIFKVLPFYDLITELMKPTSLAPRGSSKFQETHFNFHLTPQQAQDIAMSRDFRPGAKFEYTTQIQLRFCLLETSCEQDDHFPPSICVRVNGKMAPLPNPIPTTKPGVEPKRPGRPVDITPLCRLSPTMPNQVEISWASDFGRGYCVAINLVKKLSSDVLLQRLKQFGSRHADHTRALKIFRLTDSNEIQFSEDGNWKPIKATKDTVVISSPVIKPVSSSPNDAVSVTGESPSKKPKFDVIDLTLSSDEDDDDYPMASSSKSGCVSPPVISLDSPTPVPSVSSSDSPLVSSPRSNSSSKSSSSSSSNNSSASSSPKSVKSPYGSQASTIISSPRSPSLSPHNSPISPPSSSILPSIPLTSSQIRSPVHSVAQSQPLSFINRISPAAMSPVNATRISPVTPPTSLTNFPPFQPITAPTLPHVPPTSSYPFGLHYSAPAPEIDREIEDFLRGISWELPR
ncbi:hypothetical protein KUTeg_017810 [Tegillarca granosa]|uniref:PINIT domain-containing protein n=1 Tax=Tegillarca granosa TaxID=220873 RepID=A0ABQ9EKW4_TEGGR|nr:hypothetical protein KUTeg_017810 [Tegillarca granosa]